MHFHEKSPYEIDTRPVESSRNESKIESNEIGGFYQFTLIDEDKYNMYHIGTLLFVKYVDIGTIRKNYRFARSLNIA